jgi:hypothetical protein
MFRFVFILLLITSFMTACGGDDADVADGPAPTGIEIAGTYASDFGTETITEDTWSSDFGGGPSVSAIVHYSNAENVAVTQSADDAEFYPGLFNRIVWTEPSGGAFHYCTTDFGLESEEAALEADTAADATDLDGAGCGGFSWTALGPA